jgi:glycosyltransferase involved in cell wall biosynthesis
MTVFFNVTDALGSASHHGITRTERMLAAALVGRPGVAFVVLKDQRLWCVDHPDVVEAMNGPDGDVTPIVERFGVDRAVPRPRVPASRRLVASIRARRGDGSPYELSAPRVHAGDALVSVGLDWVHGLLDEAERWVFARQARYFGFCYDLIPIDHPEWLFPPDPYHFQRHLRRVTRVASSVLCISEHTRSDFVRHFPRYGAERVRVVRLGADAAINTRPEHQRFAESLFDGEPYAVYCATLDRRKNHQLLYRVAKEMARRGVAGNIAFVGKIGSGVADLLDSLRHDSLVAGRIAHISNCDDQHLAAIYRRARFAVYPSLYEGWGLGVTEALAHGTPCIVATGSSLDEAGLGVCPALHPLQTSHWVDAMAGYFQRPPALPPIELPTWHGAADSLLDTVAM